MTLPRYKVGQTVTLSPKFFINAKIITIAELRYYNANHFNSYISTDGQFYFDNELSPCYDPNDILKELLNTTGDKNG